LTQELWTGNYMSNKINKPLARYEELINVSTGLPTGRYQLSVGDLILYSVEYDKSAAEKWLPLIVEAINKHQKENHGKEDSKRED